MQITATHYQAKLLKAKGQQAMALRDFCAAKLHERGIEFLSPFEELCLWREVVKAVDYPNLDVLIAICSDTLNKMQLYAIPLSAIEAFEHESVSLFRSLVTKFLHKQKLTFYEALHQLEISQPCTLTGFVDLPPLYRQVFSNIQNLNAVRSGLKTDHILATVFVAKTPVQEFLQALHEIEKQWQKDKSQTFALVVSQQDLPWKQIHRLLKIHDSSMSISCAKAEAEVDQPKFLFLKDLFASRSSMKLSVLSRVLVSPFWREDQERRATLDVWLRHHVSATSSLAEILQSLLFHDPTLAEASWFQSWELLSRFEATELESAAQLILDAASFKMRDSGSKAGTANLHIVGSLEAVDLPVDCVWLLSADQDHYSAQPNTSVFLPQMVLKQYGVPCDADAAKAFGERLLSGMTQGKAISASFVEVLKGEEKVLCEWIKPTQGHGSEAGDLGGRATGVSQLDLHGDGFCQVKPFEGQAVLGGTRVLKEQAECPFKAFGHFRLNTQELGQGRALLNPMQKGSLVHAVLEKVWSSLQSQEHLLTRNSEEREELVARKVDEVLFAQNPQQRSLLKKLERGRLIRLVLEWLALEAKRPYFTVKACEAEELATIQGLQFRLRLDRLDTTEGGEIVIDYKTGHVSSKGWFDERLTEPQLPVYAVGNQAAGTIFASLKPGEMGYAGAVAGAVSTFDKVKAIENWGHQLQTWQAKLALLADEFKQGRADVAPADPAVCQYCDLASLCRIKSLSLKG